MVDVQSTNGFPRSFDLCCLSGQSPFLKSYEDFTAEEKYLSLVICAAAVRTNTGEMRLQQ